MPPLLYLDTARLGQMTPAAKDAQLDFVRLSAEEPSSLYFEEFLRDGYPAWPSFYQERFRGLRTWTGVAGLKHSIRRLAGAPDDWQVLLAGRSLPLVRLASSCMFRVCRNVLATDLSWPTYERDIEAKARLTSNRITTVPLRDGILNRGWTVNDVASYLAAAFTEHQCDGLFLPAVDHLGIRLPVRDIVQRIERRSELRFCFIDAAQAFCQVPISDCLTVADFVVAGSHKWMGGYLPTGIGLFGQRRSRDMIAHCVRRPEHAEHNDDPLLQFTEQLDTGTLDGHSETANLAALFAMQGAAADLSRPARRQQVVASIQGIQREKLTSLASELGWKPLQPAEDFRSRILLIESPVQPSQGSHRETLRRAMLEANVIATSYEGGRLRFSMPPALSEEDLLVFKNAISQGLAAM